MTETTTYYNPGLYCAISSETTSIPLIDFRVASAIVQSANTDVCNIKAECVIQRLNSNASAKVIQPFSIQLTRTEEGYVATSNLCNIYELEETRGDAVRRYLYSLVDELIWLKEQGENLSNSLREERNRINTYIRIV